MGRIRYNDADYEGDISFGVPHGYGKIWYTNGDYYEGGFSEGMFHGEGVFYHANGEIRKGIWENL